MTQRIVGIHAVEAALTSPSGRVTRVYLDRERADRFGKLADLARRAGVPVESVSRHELDRKDPSRRHQGVVADVRAHEGATLEETLKRIPAGGRVAVVLDGVTDPQNLGAILRSCGAFGVSFMVLPRDRSAQVTPLVDQISSGASDAVPIVTATNLTRALETLKEAGFWCYSLEAEGDAMLHEIDLSGDVAIVMGSEGKGARRLVREHTDRVCRLPAVGPIASLNVAAATACALYEVHRQRLTAPKRA